ncbi:M50 family metallopeptidase [Rhodobacteraceae bacterium D3-12]|nr:M50 family metallopeptidase [Rhodobacteraceae bacterium D3-12]
MIAALQKHWLLLAMTAGVALLWGTPVLVPLKILVVFFHELSHLITVLLTGGSVESLSLTSNEGGAVMARGGNRFLTLSAGYLGSLLIGLGLIWAALRSQLDRWVVAGLGVVLLAVAAFYVRDSFALIFCIAGGALLLALARFLPHGPNDFALRLIGLTSIIYVPLDIFSDTLARAHLHSDARMLAEEFGGTTMFWGGLWLMLSLVAVLFALRGLLR